jgi:LytS/YehU family sensor histidine kinase
VPAFLLQPLVENAIKHGVGPRAAGGRVDVEARRAGGSLALAVRDDGVGLPAGWALADHAGVGLGNVAGRLDALYPGGHRFGVGAAPGGGVLVEVEVPFGAASPGARPGAA